MWPTVKAAIDFVLGLQTPRGEIIWRRDADGTPGKYALLTGSASMYSSLRCAIMLAEYLAEPQPDWELAADQLAHAVASHPEAFADKSRFSMDWYYPVLGGPVRGQAARDRLDQGWDTYVVPDLGVRCVRDEPWVTAAETAELAITLEAIGDATRALDLLDQIQLLRDPTGAYWTGWQYVEPAALPQRAEQLHRRRDRAGRRHHVRRDRRVVALPRRRGRTPRSCSGRRRGLRLRTAGSSLRRHPRPRLAQASPAKLLCGESLSASTIRRVSSIRELNWRPLDRDQVQAWADLVAATEAVDHQDEHVAEEDLLEEFDDPDADFPDGSIAAYDGAVMVGWGILGVRSAAEPVHEMGVRSGTSRVPGPRHRVKAPRLV